MKVNPLHSWNLSLSQAIALQKKLAGHVVLENSFSLIQTIAGVDVSYKKNANLFHAAIVVLDYGSMELVESASASGEVSFPYVPGLLSFRELPVLLDAFSTLSTVPDIIIADAQGIAHPRRLGLASHLGLWLELPTIGCAKSRLCGGHVDPGVEKGKDVPLVDCEQEIGWVLRTKERVKPMFVSPGHLVDMRSAAAIALHCSRGYRMPEPTRQAHLLSNKVRLEYSGTH